MERFCQHHSLTIPYTTSEWDATAALGTHQRLPFVLLDSVLLLWYPDSKSVLSPHPFVNISLGRLSSWVPSPVLWRLRSHLRPLFRCLFLACFFFTCIGLREPPSLVDTGLWEDNLDSGYNYYIDPGFVWPKDFMIWSHSVM